MKIEIAWPPRAREILSDLFLVAGTGSAGFGAWHLGEPFAWIFGGLVAMGFGYRLGRRGP
jgi:hypothetical protein